MNFNFKSFFSNWIVRNIIGAVIAMLVLSLLSKFLLGGCTKHGKEIDVPDFIGMTIGEAASKAERDDVRIDVVDSIYVKGAERGSVVRQNPATGAKVKKGRRIMLTINATVPKQIPMPNLIGFSMRSAKAELISRGLVLDRLIYLNDIATNNVLRQLYNGSEIEPGTMISSESRISLVLGLNDDDCTTSTPKLTALTYEKAVESIHDHSLNINNAFFDKDIRNYADSASAVVYKQTPEYGTGKIMGSGMTIYLTLDQNKVLEAENRDAARENAQEESETEEQ